MAKYGDITITNGDGWFLTKSGRAKLTGLPKGTAFTIKEVQSIGGEEFNSAGYTTEYKINDADAVTGKSASGTLTSPSKVSFVNTRKEAALNSIKGGCYSIYADYPYGICIWFMPVFERFPEKNLRRIDGRQNVSHDNG